jgi:3-oxoacyl-[acyl-carrier protein] reductase
MKRRSFADLAEGEIASSSHRIRAEDVDHFAELSGDLNPLHIEDDFARRHGFRGRVVHGMLLGAHLSRVLGTVLPGPGVVWLSQSTRFVAPAYVGDRIEVAVRIAHRSPALRTLVLEISISNQREETLMTGEAKVMMVGEGSSVPWTELVAIVTGGSRGIGAAVARAMGQRGARVVFSYLRRHEAAEEVVETIEADGGEAVAVQADVASEEGTRRLGETALEAYGRVDAVINNATPPIERKAFDELSWEETDAYWRAYVQSPFLLAKHVLPGMKERGFGRFVHLLTSAVWGAPPPQLAGYVAAKSGLWGLAKSMAVELAPFGITVNAVSPSAVMTEQWTDEPETRRRALALKIPTRRLATPEEVAAVIMFLVGEEGAYVTGTNLPVAGGEVM